MRHIVLKTSFIARKLDLLSATGWIWIVLFSVFGAGGCRHTPAAPNNLIPIKSYYYPIHKLDGGMMFVYKYKNDRMPEFYYHLKTQKLQDSLYLKVTELRGDFSVEQRITEQIFPSGSKIIDYQMMDLDSSGQEYMANLEILSGDTYPFYVEKNGGVYIFQAKWFFPNNPEFKYTLIRNRRYAGDTTFVFKGQKTPAIKMSAKELIVTESEGYQELEFNKTEIYAKGLGLVSSKTIVSDSFSLEYQLVDTFSGSLLPAME